MPVFFATFSLYTKEKKSPKKRNSKRKHIDAKKRPAQGRRNCISFSILWSNGNNDNANDPKEKSPPKAAFHASVACDGFCNQPTNQTED
jgi:hypothetical protein